LLKVKNKILTTGKYLNVIRECGIEMNGAHWVREFKYSENEHTYIEQVNEALRHASELVLDLLRKNYKLMGRLQSMKRYFLLDQADFMSYFMDTAMSELVKPVGTVTDDTLQSLFELSLRMSSSKDDPFWEDIVCGSSQWSITTMLMMAAENKDAPFDQNPNHLGTRMNHIFPGTLRRAMCY
jgi:gamma-tubulin complex component 2